MTTSGGTRAVEVANLVIASCAVFFALTADCDCRWAGSPPPSPYPPSGPQTIIMDSVTVIWFVGALGLRHRTKIAWCGSVLGAGAAAIFWLTRVIETISAFVHPNAEMQHVREFGIIGCVFAFVFETGVFSTLILIPSLIVTGLIFKRKALIAGLALVHEAPPALPN